MTSLPLVTLVFLITFLIVLRATVSEFLIIEEQVVSIQNIYSYRLKNVSVYILVSLFIKVLWLKIYIFILINNHHLFIINQWYQ